MKPVVIIRVSENFHGTKRILAPFTWINDTDPKELRDITSEIFRKYAEKQWLRKLKPSETSTIHPTYFKVPERKMEKFKDSLCQYYTLAQEYGYDFESLERECMKLFNPVTYITIY